jgi:hypothetical protein
MRPAKPGRRLAVTGRHPSGATTGAPQTPTPAKAVKIAARPGPTSCFVRPSTPRRIGPTNSGPTCIPAHEKDEAAAPRADAGGQHQLRLQAPWREPRPAGPPRRPPAQLRHNGHRPNKRNGRTMCGSIDLILHARSGHRLWVRFGPVEANRRRRLCGGSPDVGKLSSPY